MSKLKKSAMALSAAGLLAIAGYEGYSELAYQPLPGDAWTIGFGHTGGVQPGDKVSPREALSLLKKDTRLAEATVNRYVTVELKQYQFDALVSLTYNIGSFAFRQSTLLDCLNLQDYVCVHREWMRWVYFKGKPQKGLQNRRAKELYVFRGGQNTVGSDGRVCFGRDQCFTASEILQDGSGQPDKASYGGDGTV